MVMGDVELGIRLSTIPHITHMTIVDCWVYILLIFLFKKVFTVTKYVIVAVMTEEMDLGLKRPATITFTIMEKVLMVIGDMDIGIRPPTIPTMTHAGLANCWVSLLLEMREVG